MNRFAELGIRVGFGLVSTVGGGVLAVYNLPALSDGIEALASATDSPAPNETPVYKSANPDHNTNLLIGSVGQIAGDILAASGIALVTTSRLKPTESSEDH